MSRRIAVLAGLALLAAAPSPASAAPLRYCEGAGAGDSTPNGREWRNLYTRNLSCRKGLAVMKAFVRRHPSGSEGSFTARVKGFRCRASFSFHPEGGVLGTVGCRKGIRRATWSGFGLSSGGGGGPGGG